MLSIATPDKRPDKRKRDTQGPVMDGNRETKSDGDEVAKRIVTAFDIEIAMRPVKRKMIYIDGSGSDDDDSVASTVIQTHNDAATQTRTTDVADAGDDHDCSLIAKLSLFAPTAWQYEEMSQTWDNS